MQLETLEVFCDVVKYRSFSKAATARGITQSAASQIVSLLEKRMDVQLIDRSTRPLKMTPLGRTYFEGCKSVLEQYAGLEASIRSAQARLAGTVRVAAIYSVGLTDLGQYVHRFHALEPGAHVELEYLHPDEVYQKVLDGTADLGLISFPHASSKISADPWREEPMVLACPPQHPLAENKSVKPSDLVGIDYIHFDKRLSIRRRLDRFWRDLRIDINVVLEFDNIENIKQAVTVGAGVALLPEPTLQREVKSGSLVALPLEGASISRPLGVIHRKRRSLTDTTLRFLHLLLENETEESEKSPYQSKSKSRRKRSAIINASAQINGAHRLAK